MEFDFTSLAFGGEPHICVWDAAKIRRLSTDDIKLLTQMLDVFGKRSAVAQGLQAPVTDIQRLLTTDQRIYLYIHRQSQQTSLLGGLKIGTKRLFVRTADAELKEITPICVLDFYVHESVQRQGIGKLLFEHFLAVEGLNPAALAYDRPSPKLIGFLRKHYGLADYTPQANNYVVFNQYWELNPTPGVHRVSLVSASRFLDGGVAGALGAGRAPFPLPISTASSTPLSFGNRYASNLTSTASAARASEAAAAAAAAEHAASSSPTVADLMLSVPSHDALDQLVVQQRETEALARQPSYRGTSPADASRYDSPASAYGGVAASGGSYSAGMAPPASRSIHTSRPPWAVDDGPLHHDQGASGSASPYAKAAQQLNGLQLRQSSFASPSFSSRGTPVTVPSSSGSVDRAAARSTAAAQRSGAGAADCLVW